ncbi:tellurite resistance TerB family protein [Xinfangfangia pollutisoli]|uniref:tellurite resistance TerB family protein n=1 Tax=Xinfangfangia pollutisoli TaxID=2865960 RepID=UPI001CD33087|nr:tellurite resistance TerB family protein [Xinfangfangia pollutisoli]
MFNPSDLLDKLTGGKGVQGLADRAKATWQGQSTLGKGAIAGGVLGVLLSSGGRRLLGTGLKVGGAAAIGGLAYQAYQDWKAGRDPLAPAQPGALPPPPPETTGGDFALSLVKAMIAAAKADGHVTPDERERIDAALAKLDLDPDETALIQAELDAPLDVRRVAALARTEAEAAQIYTATLLVVDEQSLEEKGYLAMLAAALNLDDGLKAHLAAQAARLG